MPRISVILPVRNGGTYLAFAVGSILAQDFHDFELILVDDHSSDNALADIPGDPRLKILQSDGGGVSAAFNTGFKVSSGEYVARMDADDLAMPARLSAQAGLLDANPDVSICGACVEIFSEESSLGAGNQRYQAWLNDCREPGQIAREIFIESPIPNPTAMFRRSALEMLGGYAEPGWPEDYDLYLRAAEMNLKMAKPEPVLLRWREHGARLTHTDSRYQWSQFQAAKAHYLARRLAAQGGCNQHVVIWGAGPSGAQFHDLLVQEGQACEGFLEVHPRRIGGEKRGRPVWPLSQVDQLEGAFIAVAVGSPGVRDEIRQFMQRPGWAEGDNWLFVA